MSYYRFGETRVGYNQPTGFDRTRGYEIGKKVSDELRNMRFENLFLSRGFLFCTKVFGLS